MGYSKGQFCSLRGLQQSLHHHTLISIIEEGSEDAEFQDKLVREGTTRRSNRDTEDTTHAAAAREPWGQQKGSDLKDMLFESGIAESRE